MTAGIDLADPDFWSGDPYPTLERLRRTDPVFRHPAPPIPGGREFWALTRHEDIVHVSKNPDTFCSGRGVGIASLTEDPAEGATGYDNMVQMDDPRHKWMRALVNKGFIPPRIRRLEPHVRDLATEVLDRVADAGECDFVADIAAQLPINVIGEMLGVPREDRHLIKEWSDAFTDSDITDGSDDTATAMAAAGHMFEYLARMQEERRPAPRDDLVSVLMEAEVEGRRLTLAEQQGFFLLLEFAGNETTRNVIAGGMLALAEHPDQKQRLLDDPSLMTSAAEEMLRWTSPVIQFRRTVTRDVELRGRQLRSGDWVVMFYGAGNRDEDVFANPDDFDVARTPNPHVSLGGGGPHFCLGAPLGRLEIRVMFEELLRRFPEVAVCGPAERTRSNFIRGIRTLPVALGRGAS